MYCITPPTHKTRNHTLKGTWFVPLIAITRPPPGATRGENDKHQTNTRDLWCAAVWRCGDTPHTTHYTSHTTQKNSRTQPGTHHTACPLPRQSQPPPPRAKFVCVSARDQEMPARAFLAAKMSTSFLSPPTRTSRPHSHSHALLTFLLTCHALAPPPPPPAP